jgi:sulfatase-like protein
VLVTLDTLRADRVGVYGDPADTTPNLDRIAREGAFARHASAHVPLTRASHATMLSGLLPWQHGIRDNISPGELPPSPLLAEMLKAQGFATGAFVSSIVLAPQAGLGRGFDVFSDKMTAAPGTPFLHTLQRRGEDTLKEALAWLEAGRGRERLFLWLHLYDRSPIRRASRAVSTTARSPTRTISSAGSTPRSDGWACATTRCSWWPPTTARASANTARPCMASSCTRRRWRFP